VIIVRLRAESPSSVVPSAASVSTVRVLLARPEPVDVLDCAATLELPVYLDQAQLLEIAEVIGDCPQRRVAKRFRETRRAEWPSPQPPQYLRPQRMADRLRPRRVIKQSRDLIGDLAARYPSGTPVNDQLLNGIAIGYAGHKDSLTVSGFSLTSAMLHASHLSEEAGGERVIGRGRGPRTMSGVREPRVDCLGLVDVGLGGVEHPVALLMRALVVTH
jgi:hypothetical protein